MKIRLLWAVLLSPIFAFQAQAQDTPAPEAAAAPAASETGSIRTKFYDFNDLLIQGEFKRPTVLYTEARRRTEFDRLLRLKRDVIRDMLATAADPALR